MPFLRKNLSNKPRLLIILNRFVIGGQAADTIPLAWYLKDEFSIRILYGSKEQDEVEPLFLLQKYPGLYLKKIGYLRRSINPLIDLLAFFRILLLILRFNPHVVHTHGAKSGFIGRITAWLLGVPVIIHTFHGHFFHSYFSRRVSRLIAFAERCVSHITTSAIALSGAQKIELADKFGVFPAAKIKIIPLGFAFENNDANALRRSFRSRYGLTDTDVAIGIVGRIVPVKNHAFFLEVIEKVLGGASGKNAAFLIIGDGDLRSRLETTLSQKNIAYNNTSVSIANRVVFTSWLTNIYEVMNGLDIVALTSLNEGTPLSLIEAQFFKKPVVSTNAGGVSDTIQNGKTGFIIKENNPAAFAEKLELLIDNKTLRQAIGEAGFSFASSAFSKQNEVAAMKDHYKTLLQQKNFHFSPAGT